MMVLAPMMIGIYKQECNITQSKLIRLTTLTQKNLLSQSYKQRELIDQGIAANVLSVPLVKAALGRVFFH